MSAPAEFKPGDRVRRVPVPHVSDYALTEIGRVVEVHEHWVKVCWAVHVRGTCGPWCGECTSIFKANVMHAPAGEAAGKNP